MIATMNTSDEKLALLQDEEVQEVSPNFVQQDRPQRSVLRKLCSLGCFVLLALAIAVITLPLCHLSKFLPAKSIEERVHKILAETPLIGECLFIMSPTRQKSRG